LPGPPLKVARNGLKRGAGSRQQGKDTPDKSTKRSKENDPDEGTLAEGWIFSLDEDPQPDVGDGTSGRDSSRERLKSQGRISGVVTTQRTNKRETNSTHGLREVDGSSVPRMDDIETGTRCIKARRKGTREDLSTSKFTALSSCGRRSVLAV
jgi:hypothetical protein